MMSVIGWGFFVGLVLAREIYRLQRNRKLDHELKVLEWRERFARTRRETVDLIRRREILPDSAVAEALYMNSSLLVRRASSYRGLANAIFIEAIRQRLEKPLARRLKKEVPHLTPSARDVWLRHADDVGGLVQDFSWILKFVVFLDPWVHAVSFLLKVGQAPFTRRIRPARRFGNGLMTIETSRQMKAWAT